MTSNSDKINNLPAGMTWLDTQVAGHQSDAMKNSINYVQSGVDGVDSSTPSIYSVMLTPEFVAGMIKMINGCVLKSSHKVDLQEREISFYEKIRIFDEPLYHELSKLTPKYYGTKELELGNQRVQFIVLEDLTADMTEPCVMDIKIGKRTWDPLSNASKRESEEKKYAESKRAYGLCIPGFQVYDLSTNDLRKFTKDYGKNLNKETFLTALKIFLNAQNDDFPWIILVNQIIISLKKIEDFFKRQKNLKFYSSSILIVYDAHFLKELSKKSSEFHHKNIMIDGASNSVLIEDISEDINFLRVRMIDFTHVFESEDEGLDINYLEGITNLIKVLESCIR